MEQYQEGEAMSVLNDYQKKQNDIYQEHKSIEYLVLMLTSRVGMIAREAAFITRGDYEGKGAHIHQAAVDGIISECATVVRYVSLIATVFEKKMSDVLEYSESRKQHTL